MRSWKASSLRNVPELWLFSAHNKEPATVSTTFAICLLFDYFFKYFHFCIERRKHLGVFFTIVHDSSVTMYEILWRELWSSHGAISNMCRQIYVSYFHFTTLSVSKIIYIFIGWMNDIRERKVAGMILTENNRRTWRETYSGATLSTPNPTRWRILSCGTWQCGTL